MLGRKQEDQTEGEGQMCDLCEALQGPGGYYEECGECVQRWPLIIRHYQ